MLLTLSFSLFKRVAPELSEEDRDTITRAQIYFDSQWFGPGKTNGRMGTFTRQAAEDYNLRHGHDAANWYHIIKAEEKSVKKQPGRHLLARARQIWYWLHGTNNPETIGRAQSAGCIRLANWDAVHLSQLFRPGATVEVR